MGVNIMNIFKQNKNNIVFSLPLSISIVLGKLFTF